MHQQSDYVPLHLHTEYSLLDGAIRIDELIKKASLYKMPAISITDHGNLFGVIEFYKAALDAEIQPIIGCEVYVAPSSRFEKKQIQGTDEGTYHLILLAKDNKGYKNLVNLVTRAYTEGFYYKPRIDRDLLIKYNEGLICLTSCLKGEIPFFLQRGMIEKARSSADFYRELFGFENFYLEVQDNGLPEQAEVNKKLVDLSKELNVGLVATNDCHYLMREDARAHDILLCIQTNKTVADKDRMCFNSDEFYFKSPEEMKEAFKELPEAIINTRKIAEKCNVRFEMNLNLLPVYEISDGRTPDEFLEKLAMDGLYRRLGDKVNRVYKDRLIRELNVIKEMGYSSYFLIVWDFISFAKRNNIPVGPGRGSAAGSLVSYCLGITDIDPVKYNLLFERFLNPERVSMPDIDVDFCKVRRAEVINYVAEKYGKEHVAQIITFGTMAARAAIRDVGRALGFSYGEVDKIAKLIPNAHNITIEDSLNLEPRLMDIYKTSPRIKELIDIARRLEGLCRHVSTHAAGVVISPHPLTEYTPLYKNPSDGTITTQFDMEAIESIGLLKFDFLGLKTLTVIDKTIKYIKDNGKEFSLKDISLEDKDTYELLSSGNTTGIFQLESSGMKDLLVRISPSRFEDLIAIVALYRPGPMGSGMLDDFIKRKKGIVPVKYDLPQLRDILDETYGIILYQEQVMRIANELANFTMGQADLLRKAMGKKLPEEMEKQKESFIRGAMANGISEKKAKKIFDFMSYFAEYGFNKSHSAAYAYIAYQTAYLKAHYPVEFMAATLSADMDNTDRVVRLIAGCREMGIEVLPPDINLSDKEFKVIGNSIRFGLEAVKGVGSSALESILKARKSGGFFKSLEDFLERIDQKKVNKKVIESLIKAGAFDSLGLSRAKAMHIFTQIADNHSNIYNATFIGQQSIFGSDYGVQDNRFKEWSFDEILRFEKESLGFYISGHPLTKYKKILEEMGTTKISLLEDLEDGSEVVIGGVLTSFRRIKTKTRSEIMCYCQLEGPEGNVEAIIFPELYNKKINILQEDEPLIVRGKIDKTEKGIKIIATDLIRLDDISGKGNNKVLIRLDAEDISKEKLQKLYDLISSEGKGVIPFWLSVIKDDKEVIIETQLKVSNDKFIIDTIEEIIGKGKVLIQ
jgi:DNA polymerase-3 subunit alpha